VYEAITHAIPFTIIEGKGDRFIMLYGSVLSMIFAIDATFVAGLFLYNSTFSSYLWDPHQAGELFLFALTALIGAKCAAEIARPSERSHGPLWANVDEL
jgi:hypothetical protein